MLRRNATTRVCHFDLRVLTVALDNFAQELVSKMETEYLDEN